MGQKPGKPRSDSTCIDSVNLRTFFYGFKISNILQINSFEFIISAVKERYNGLYKYNIKTNRWSVLLLYPQTLETTNSLTHSVNPRAMQYKQRMIGNMAIATNGISDNDQYDIDLIVGYLRLNCIEITEPHKNEIKHIPLDICKLIRDFNKNQNIYLFGATKIIQIDLETNEFISKMAKKEFGKFPNVINQNGIFHVIGGGRSCFHRQYVEKYDNTQSLECVEIKPQSQFGYLVGAGFVYISSQKLLLLFGGLDECKWNKKDMIWRYCLMQKKWKLCRIRLPYKLSHFGYVLTNDERYIVIIGGVKETKINDEILVLDVLNMQWITDDETNTLKIKDGGEYFAVIMPNDDIHVLRPNVHFKMHVNDIIRY